MQKIQDGLYFSTQPEDMDLDMIFTFIKSSYWGGLRTFDEQRTAMENTLNFGLFRNDQQIAYARVMSDMAFFAYLLDVFVVESERGKGHSKILMKQILTFPSLKSIDRWMLATKDAHTLYEQFGFERVKAPEKLMDRMSERAKSVYE